MKSLHLKSIRAILLIVIAGGFFIISCSTESKKPKNSLESIDLKGKIKSLVETNYYAETKDGEIQKTKVLSVIKCLFNERGNFIEREYFDSDSIQISKSTYKYDLEGNLIEKITIDKAGDLAYKETYKYDEKENLIEKISLNNSVKSEYRETYKYDENGNEIEMDSYITDGSLGVIELFKDEKGNIISYRNKPYSGPGLKIQYKYDEKGNKTEERHYKRDGIFDSKYINKFDDQGNKIESDVYNSNDSLIYLFIYKYDEKGNVIKEYNGDSEANMEVVIDCKYDDRSNLVEENIYYYGNDSKNIYQYENYDKYGNWFLRVESGSYKSITERFIEYY